MKYIYPWQVVPHTSQALTVFISGICRVDAQENPLCAVFLVHKEMSEILPWCARIYALMDFHTDDFFTTQEQAKKFLDDRLYKLGYKEISRRLSVMV